LRGPPVERPRVFWYSPPAVEYPPAGYRPDSSRRVVRVGPFKLPSAHEVIKGANYVAAHKVRKGANYVAAHKVRFALVGDLVGTTMDSFG
jgi:hypothetical protein